MNSEQKTVRPLSGKRFLDESGKVVTPPDGWEFLPAGDAGVTRKVTSKGNFWKVETKMGKRTISKGIWAPADVIHMAKKETETIRSTDEYQHKMEKAKQARERKQQEYELSFEDHVRKFLNFHQRYKEVEDKLAKIVTTFAIPVGSGTVARTETIPVEERAKRAVIAWMRHNTTKYDSLYVERIKGKRREVRSELARESHTLLGRYRKGEEIPGNCPLKRALDV